MSPLNLRRYRAERLLRAEFEQMRSSVLNAVRARLRAQKVVLDEDDLQAAYSQAWHGLYATVLAGEQIDNPAAWLVLVAYRRAIDEHRRMRRRAAELHSEVPAPAEDLADLLEDRLRARQLLAGIATLGERERQAAALCYLQGLSRGEAARVMHVGEKRMQKLMDGSGGGRPGVAAKVGSLAQAVSAGRFCAEHASLMRALAFGVLDPDGERHRVAMTHVRECPACRSFVRSLRGLAAVLPPVFLPGPLASSLGRGERAGNAAKRLARGREATDRAMKGLGRGEDPTGRATRAPGRGEPTGGRGEPTGRATKALGRLRGLRVRLAGSSASGVKIAAASMVLLGGAAAGVALTAASSGAHPHRAQVQSGGVIGRSTAGPTRQPTARQALARARRRRPAASASTHRGRHGSLGRSTQGAPSVPAALREFGIERHSRASSALTPTRAAPASSRSSPTRTQPAPATSRSAPVSHAEREFGVQSGR